MSQASGAVYCHIDDVAVLSSCSILSNHVAPLIFAAFVKLGFIVDGLTSITPYVNGVAGTAITTNVPIVEMPPSFVSQSTALAVDPITHVDWVACNQAEDIAN